MTYQAVQGIPDEETRQKIGSHISGDVANAQSEKAELDDEGQVVEGDNHFANYERMNQHGDDIVNGDIGNGNGNDKDNGSPDHDNGKGNDND